MTDEELIKFASEFRAGILDGRPSFMMCAAVCLPLSSLLEMHGVKNEVVEIQLGDLGDVQCANHVYLRLADGRILDPTADQFNDANPQQWPPVYLGKPSAMIHYKG